MMKRIVGTIRVKINKKQINNKTDLSKITNIKKKLVEIKYKFPNHILSSQFYIYNFI